MYIIFECFCYYTHIFFCSSLLFLIQLVSINEYLSRTQTQSHNLYNKNTTNNMYNNNIVEMILHMSFFAFKISPKDLSNLDNLPIYCIRCIYIHIIYFFKKITTTITFRRQQQKFFL